MPSGTATTKPQPVTYYWLKDPTDATACLEALITKGFHGTIGLTKDQAGAAEWIMTIDTLPDNPTMFPQTICRLNDVVVIDAANRVTVMRIEAFNSTHDTEEQ